MARTHRPRRLAAGVLALGVLLLGACTGSGEYPNTTFNHTTEFNTAVDALWDRLLFLGTLVFVGVEAALIYTVVKFRRREGQQEPRHVHGNTTLEILWTIIPAVILMFIAIPTVRTIFKTQAKAVPNALQVEVVGHQWWWEFRYPQYTTRNARGGLDTLTTANELYLPTGRTVNFALRTADVLHSFWIPRLGGKRDLISNHTNYLWYTPVDSMAEVALNGSCNEYCGASHANMKFRAFTVTPQQFESWAAGQLQPAAVGAAPAAPGATATTAPTVTPNTPATVALASAQPAPGAQDGATTPASAGYVFPKDKLPQYFVPTDDFDTDVRYDDRLKGDVTRGQQAFLIGGCVGCHMISGNPVAMGRTGPNLTHVGSRYTIAGAQYPNETAYLARWIKNSKKMKPGSLMPTLGKGETDPVTGQVMQYGLTDQQIADVVAYLQALK